jgi:lysozyme family protein
MPYLRSNEGGWSYVPGDKGGMTYVGISRVMHPEWEGWRLIDLLNLPVHDAHACNAILDANVQIQALVFQFYATHYWAYDGLQSQDVATKLFDGAVNMQGGGKSGPAIMALQRAIGCQPVNTVPIDGQYGPNTENMANRCEPDSLLQDLARFYVLHYNAILVAHPNDEKFRAGWLARAVKLPSDGMAVGA